jgi:hypothetical protein
MSFLPNKRLDATKADLLAHALGLQSQYGHEPAQRYLEGHGFSRALAYKLLAMQFDRRAKSNTYTSTSAKPEGT